MRMVWYNCLQTEQVENAIEEEVQLGHPTPMIEGPRISLGSKEADDQGLILLDKINLRLVESMGKDVNRGLKIFSRKKNGNRELENLKSSINYEGGNLKSFFS